jgi:hypothetical protein
MGEHERGKIKVHHTGERTKQKIIVHRAGD